MHIFAEVASASVFWADLLSLFKKKKKKVSAWYSFPLFLKMFDLWAQMRVLDFTKASRWYPRDQYTPAGQFIRAVLWLIKLS